MVQRVEHMLCKQETISEPLGPMIPEFSRNDSGAQKQDKPPSATRCDPKFQN